MVTATQTRPKTSTSMVCVLRGLALGDPNPDFDSDPADVAGALLSISLSAQAEQQRAIRKVGLPRGLTHLPPEQRVGIIPEPIL